MLCFVVLTAGRTQARVALAIALASAIIGWRALIRARDHGQPRRSIAALATAVIGATLGGLRLAASTAIGTGSGRLGATAALVLASVGLVLGGLGLVRSTRAR
jgi:hypothetical protein